MIKRHDTSISSDCIRVYRVGLNAPLDRGQQTGGLFWSADFPPRMVHLFPPRLLSKNEAEMRRPRREMGVGVNDLHCCVTHN